MPARRASPCAIFPSRPSAINDLMPRLLAELNARAPLAAGIAAVHFLSTQAGDMLVSLIYAEPLHARWRDEALKMQRALKLAAVVGRAKGTCVKLPRDWVVESYALADGRRLRYQQLERLLEPERRDGRAHALVALRRRRRHRRRRRRIGRRRAQAAVAARALLRERQPHGRARAALQAAPRRRD